MKNIMEYRIATRSLKKAIKHLCIANKYKAMSNEWIMHWNLYNYFRGIYTAHEKSL